MSASPQQIVHALKRDMAGDLTAGIRYAEKIAAHASMNPFADADMAPNYAEAARILKAELPSQPN